MSGPLFYFAILLILATMAVLLVGLRNLMRQGDSNVSNKLMQLRVFLQFIAVVIIVLVVYLARQGS